MDKRQIDEFGESFIQLALEINKHIEGYVDAYYGPEGLRERVEASAATPPKQLLEAHKRLREIVPDSDPDRHRYLVAILNAMECTIRKLNGEEYDYIDEVEKLFGISPKLVPEAEFLKAHNNLDTYIPGKGTLAERIEMRRQDLEVSQEKIPDLVNTILCETRSRVEKFMPLISGERVDIDFVNDKPWGADCKYMGEYRSQVAINLDRDLGTVGLVNLLTHEVYPGHHTEFITKENHFYQNKGYAEETCILLFTPNSVIAEAIADTGFEILSSETDLYEWIADDLIPGLGQPRVEVSELFHRHKAAMSLGKCGANVALLYHSGKLEEHEAIEYIETYWLMNHKQARQMFQFIQSPLYRTYVLTYSEGYKLLEDAVKGEGKLPLFLRMINEHLLPVDLLNAT